MRYFTQDNTQGYTDDELRRMNAEAAEVVRDLEPYTTAWYDALKQLSDAIARR